MDTDIFKQIFDIFDLEIFNISPIPLIDFLSFFIFWNMSATVNFEIKF